MTTPTIKNGRVVFIPTIEAGDSRWRAYFDDVRMTDPDTESRTVLIAFNANYEPGVDEMRADPTFTPAAGITIGAFDSPTGRLVIDATGAANIAQLQAAVRSIQVRHTAAPAVHDPKQILIQLSDGIDTPSIDIYVFAADPFSVVETAIWDAIENITELAAMIPARNRRKLVGLDGIDNIQKDTLQEGDLPELGVYQSLSSEIQVKAASNLNRWDCRYEIEVLSGRLNSRKLNVVRWLVANAIHKAGLRLDLPVDFVVQILPENQTTGERSGPRVGGLVSVLTVKAELIFHDATLVYMEPVDP